MRVFKTGLVLIFAAAVSVIGMPAASADVTDNPCGIQAPPSGETSLFSHVTVLGSSTAFVQNGDLAATVCVRRTLTPPVTGWYVAQDVPGVGVQWVRSVFPGFGELKTFYESALTGEIPPGVELGQLWVDGDEVVIAEP